MVAGRPGTGMAMPPPQTGMRTAMGTAAGGGAGFGGGIREGKFTEQVYSMIRDKRYHEAIAVLSGKVMEFPNSRAAASLIAYCYYYVADYASAIAAYVVPSSAPVASACAPKPCCRYRCSPNRAQPPLKSPSKRRTCA